MIQRYDCEEYDSKFGGRTYYDHKMVADKSGEYVLYADHLAELAEKETEIAKKDEEIAALKAERDELWQTSGELCPECGWRFVIPTEGCHHCNFTALKEKVKEPENIFSPLSDPDTAYILHSGKYVIQRLEDFEKAEARVREPSFRSESRPRSPRLDAAGGAGAGRFI